MSWYLKFILLVLIFPLGIYFVVRDAKRGSEKKKIFDESPEGQKILREKAARKAARKEAAATSLTFKQIYEKNKKIFDESPEGQKILREKAARKAARKEAAATSLTFKQIYEKTRKERNTLTFKQINENYKKEVKEAKAKQAAEKAEEAAAIEAAIKAEEAAAAIEAAKLELELHALDYDVNLEEMFDLYNQVQLPILDDKWANKIDNKYGTYISDKVILYAQFLYQMKQGNKEPTSDNFDNWLGDYLEECEKKKIFDESPEGQKILREKAAIKAKENELQRKLLLESITDISGVSDKIARTILDQYPTINLIKSATKEELIEIPGVGKGLAKAIKARIG